MRVGMIVIYGLLVGRVSAGGQVPAEAHLYGRLETVGGETHVGWILWGERANTLADLLEGDKAIAAESLAELRRLRAAADPEADLAARTLVYDGVRIVWEEDDGGARADTVLSGVRFAHVRAITAEDARTARVDLRSGETMRLSARGGPDDPFVEAVRVEAAGGASASVPWAEVRRVELLSPPEGTAPAEPRLHGTVIDREGVAYTGPLVWAGRAMHPGDPLVGSAEPEERVLLGDVASISAATGLGDPAALIVEAGGAGVVTLKSGERRTIGRFGGDDGTSVRVSDPSLGIVRLPWRRVREVRFHPPAAALASPAAAGPLTGTVHTTGGDRLRGRIRWDNDEERGWELLNGRGRGVDYLIELGRVQGIAVESPRSARVTLVDGRTLELSGSNDVGLGNRGVVVEGEDGALAFVDWLDLEAVVLDVVAEVPGGRAGDVPAAAVAAPEALRREPPAPEMVATAFDDPAARELHGAAREEAFRVQRELLGYTAVVRQRAGVDLRLPLRDRTLYRAEGASRVFWSRDGGLVVQVLAAREVEPGSGPEPDVSFDGDMFYDPARSADRLTFGLIDDADDEAWFHHPLGFDAEERYRFRTGDTLTLSLPDGRSLSAVELQVIPREADFRRVSGSLWIEPRSGALVRAVYRMSDAARATAISDGDAVYIPGIFRPFTAEFTMATVDYTLWDFRVWLPRSMRIEGMVAAGILKAPGAVEVSYRMESVDLEGDLVAEPTAGAATPAASADPGTRTFRTRAEAMAYLARQMGQGGEEVRADEAFRRIRGRDLDVIRPTDPEALLRSPELPPPVWEDAPGFIGEEVLSEMQGVLAGLPVPAPAGVRWAFNWGHERPDLLRYNRVEALAVGARGELLAPTPIGPVTLRAEPFFGVADRSLKARVTVERETLRTKVALGGYRELQTASPRGSHLGLGNSVSALLFGRDEGEYFMATGADLRVTPPSARRRTWDLRLYAERHAPVETSSSFALARAFDGEWAFRPNVAAERVDELGASLLVSPWWGTDPLAPQGGIELFAQGAGGDREYARGSVTLRGSTPLFGDLRLGAEAAAGESWGDPPLQRSWFLGGSHTLRGYDPSALVGPSFARTRVDLQRTFGAVGVSLFGDGAWAGDGLDALEDADALWSAGAGFSLLGGVLRFDVAHALRDPGGWRVHLYLDGIH